jgi:hypothetical protein
MRPMSQTATPELFSRTCGEKCTTIRSRSDWMACPRKGAGLTHERCIVTVYTTRRKVRSEGALTQFISSPMQFKKDSDRSDSCDRLTARGSESGEAQARPPSAESSCIEATAARGPLVETKKHETTQSLSAVLVVLRPLSNLDPREKSKQRNQKSQNVEHEHFSYSKRTTAVDPSAHRRRASMARGHTAIMQNRNTINTNSLRNDKVEDAHSMLERSS